MEIFPTKFCKSCRQTLPKDAFKRQFKHNAQGERRPNGWSYVCKACLSFLQTEQHRRFAEKAGEAGEEISMMESKLRFATKQQNLSLINELQDRLITLCAENPEYPDWNRLLLLAFHLKQQRFLCALCRGALPVQPRLDYWPGTQTLRGVLCVRCHNHVIGLSKYTPAFLTRVTAYLTPKNA